MEQQNVKKTQPEEKIKLLMGMDTYLPDVDGVINCMHNYCKVLNDKTDLLAIVPKNKKTYIDNFPYQIKRCKSLYVPIMRIFYGFPKLDKKFKRYLYNQDFDIIHIHSPFNMGKFALKLARKKNIPIIATFHTNFRPIYKSIFKFNFITEALIKKMGRFYNKLDEIFVCSDILEEQARSYGYTGKISRAYFGTEYPKAKNCEELINQANDKFKLDAEETVFLFVGRIMKLKRIDFILDSLKLLKDKGHKFKFYVCGKGMYLEKLKKHAAKLKFTNEEIIFTGYMNDEDIKLIYARADLFLFPSLYDNFGLVKVEAAAYSTPCLMIKDSAAGMGITDGVNGYLSEDNNALFADKIETIIADKELLKQVGKNAARDIYFSWEDCSKELITKYQEIIDNTKIKE